MSGRRSHRRPEPGGAAGVEPDRGFDRALGIRVSLECLDRDALALEDLVVEEETLELGPSGGLRL